MTEDVPGATPTAPRMAAVALLGLAGLHVAWGLGSTWPLADHAAFADAVVGRREVPSSVASFAVASALGTASALAAGRPRRATTLRRLGVGGVVATLALRGALGVAGRTDLVSPGSASPRFRALDRRLYGPLCLALAALSGPAAVRRP